MEKGLFKRYYKVKLGTFAAGMYVGKVRERTVPKFSSKEKWMPMSLPNREYIPES